MSTRPHRGTGPGPYWAALVVASSAVVVRTVLLATGGVERLRDVSIADPVWAALGVLLALLCAPYVSEVQAAGTRLVRSSPSARDSSDELAELAAGTLSASDELSADQEAELAASRYLGVQLAMAGAVQVFPELTTLRLHLHVPDDTGRLVPVLEHDDPVDAWARGWDPGVGVVGRAFERRRVQVSVAPHLQAEVQGVPGKPEAAFAALRVVVAVPLINLAGRAVGVLSAAGDEEPDDAGLRELRLALEALASGVARVLVDLAAWETDDAAGATAGAGGG